MKTIGITMGDPCGIGPEIIVKALADPALRSQARFVVYGFNELLAYAADQAEVDFQWQRHPHGEPDTVRPEDGETERPVSGPMVSGIRYPVLPSSVTVLDYDELPAPPPDQHEPTLYGGRAGMAFLEDAIVAAKRKRIDALVTAPISKQAWELAGFKFPGHTELLAKRTGTRNYAMMFVAPQLKVTLATIHLGLFDVRRYFNIGCVFNAVELSHRALRQWFGLARPRIAVCGLNPHAGEGGRFGDEEARVIEPAILMAAEAGADVVGPFPADTIFRKAADGEFDCVIAMYHDQGMIPVKLLAWREAVNLTLGLPIIRTSPAHGTAFDIAGKNRADPASMKAAIQLAIDLASRETRP